MVELIIQIFAVVSWLIAMEMNSSQDRIWSSPKLTKEERDDLHKYDAVQIAILGMALAAALGGFDLDGLLFGLFFFFARAGYFPWRLNMKRKKHGINITWHHLGEGWWDRKFKGNEKLYFLVNFSGMIATLIWIFKQYA